MAATAPAGSADFVISPEIKARRTYALVILMLVYTSSHVDRSIVGILGQPIKLELGLTDTQLALMSGLAFAVFYATLGLPLAILADRMNRRNIIVAALTTWSAMTALCGLAGNYTQLLLARIGVGVGEAGSSPQSHSMISDMYAPHERSRALGFYALGVTFGSMIGYVVGGYVSVYWGWRTAFFVVGLPGIVLALIMWLTVPEPPRMGPKRAAGTLNIRKELAEGFRFIGQSRACFHVIAGITLTAFVGYGAASFTAPFLERSHGIPRDQIGLILGPVAGLFGGLGVMAGGFMADWWGRRDLRGTSWIVALGKLSAAPLVLAFYLTADATAAILFLLPASFLGAFYLGPSFAMVQSVSPAAMRATVAAIMLFILNLIALGLGPLAVGFVSDRLTQDFGFGQEGLRYALAGTSLINIWAALHFYWAASAYASEMKAKTP
ncbi:MAG TPA: MFS transporter [Alphaproteobacteria bacterium]|nr:MFS transporter [Alphaproteobacteria bacterium]HAJ46691.1 MFS transporter [Alphaproteobacteria bacterium]